MIAIRHIFLAPNIQKCFAVIGKLTTLLRPSKLDLTGNKTEERGGKWRLGDGRRDELAPKDGLQCLNSPQFEFVANAHPHCAVVSDCQ